jgi:hypothetical protein
MGGRVISGAGAESRGRLQAWDVAAVPGMASGAMMFGELEEGEGGDNEAPDGRAILDPSEQTSVEDLEGIEVTRGVDRHELVRLAHVVGDIRRERVSSCRALPACCASLRARPSPSTPRCCIAHARVVLFPPFHAALLFSCRPGAAGGRVRRARAGGVVGAGRRRGGVAARLAHPRAAWGADRARGYRDMPQHGRRAAGLAALVLLRRCAAHAAGVRAAVPTAPSPPSSVTRPVLSVQAPRGCGTCARRGAARW